MEPFPHSYEQLPIPGHEPLAIYLLIFDYMFPMSVFVAYSPYVPYTNPEYLT